VTALKAGGATHVGQVRSINQDSWLVRDEAELYAVADGMGGHNGGEVASAMAVELLEEHAGEPSLEALKEAARVGNRAIFEKAGAEAELRGMGTTLCALRVVPGPEGDELAWINVGDSRVYLYRDDRLIQLSTDHSLVEDLLRDGQLTRDEAAVHPQRNIITRALGIDVDVDVDGDTVLPFTGDRYLLCSDGLFGEVSADQMSSVLRRLADPTEAAEELVRLANEGGGRDNITVVVVDVVDDGGRAEAAAAALAAAEAAKTVESLDEVPAPAADEEAPAAPAAPAEPEPAPEPYVPVFADRRSSLPDAADGLDPEHQDHFELLDQARSKRFTWRVVLFVLALLLVVGGVVGAIAWSARGTYFVAFKGDRVALYQGKPGGVLWIDPEYVRTTGVTAADLIPAERDVISGHKTFSSRADADNYLVALQTAVTQRRQATTTTTTTTSTTSTTTTAPATTTTATPTTTATGPGR
jgi:protein phosphatase